MPVVVKSSICNSHTRIYVRLCDTCYCKIQSAPVIYVIMVIVYTCKAEQDLNKMKWKCIVVDWSKMTSFTVLIFVDVESAVVCVCIGFHSTWPRGTHQPVKRKILTQCRLNVGPPSTSTLEEHLMFAVSFYSTAHTGTTNPHRTLPHLCNGLCGEGWGEGVEVGHPWFNLRCPELLDCGANV